MRANHHEVTLAQPSFDFSMIEAKPENLIGVRAQDNDNLDKEVREDSIEMFAPHIRYRVKLINQVSRCFRRHERQWMVERFFDWIQWQRRILVLREYYAEHFIGFVQLATIAILLKQF